jgi:hypothetical protein
MVRLKKWKNFKNPMRKLSFVIYRLLNNLNTISNINSSNIAKIMFKSRKISKYYQIWVISLIKKILIENNNCILTSRLQKKQIKYIILLFFNKKI